MFGVKTLTKLTAAKEKSSGGVKLIIFLVILGVVSVVSVIWYVKQKELEDAKAELEIRKKRMEEAKRAIETAELEEKAKKAYRVIFAHLKKTQKKREKQLQFLEQSLNDTRDKIRKAVNWKDLEDA
jgi:uncharacterized protein HemX